MQSEMAEFTPPPPRRGQNNSVLDFHIMDQLCENVTSSTKPEVLIALSSKEDWAMATGNVQKIWWNLDMLFSKYASRQTDRSANVHIQAWHNINPFAAMGS